MKTFCRVLIQRQPLNYISLMAFLRTFPSSLCPESQHFHLIASHVLPEPPVPSRCASDGAGVNQQLLY